MRFGTRAAPLSYDYTRVLYDLYKNLGVLNSNLTTVDVNSDHFRHGTTILSFLYDLNEVEENCISFDTSPGILSLSLRFGQATDEPLSLYCFQLVNANTFMHSDGVIVSTN